MKWTKGAIAWGAILGLIPFAPFLDGRVDLWHAQTHWLELGILIAWLLSLGERRQVKMPVPLIGWGIYLSVSSFFMWHQMIAQTKQYPITLLMPVMHLLIAMLGVESILHMSAWHIERIMRFIAISGSIMVVYGVIQGLNLDQFFRDLDPSVGKKVHIVGTIGNPSHFAAYLSMLVPILLYQSTKWLKWMAWPAIALILISQSAAAQLSLLAGLAWLWQEDRRKLAAILAILAAGILFSLTHPSLLNAHGRLEAWQAFLDIFQKKPITGNGLGFIFQYSKMVQAGSPIFAWRHAHSLPIQLLVEQGIIGFAALCWIVGWWVCRCFSVQRTRLVLSLSAGAISFLTNSLLNFPSHLALTSGIALFCFTSSVSITEGIVE